MPPSKRYAMVFKVCSVNKELGDKAIVYLAGSAITKKKFKNIVSTLFRTG